MTTDEKEPKKTLTLNKPLGLKKGVEQVRQSFSHGRSKQVAVEVKKKRGTATNVFSKDSNIPGNLTEGEHERRVQALKDALRENKKLEETKKLEELKALEAAQEAAQEADQEKKQPETPEAQQVAKPEESAEKEKPATTTEKPKAKKPEVEVRGKNQEEDNNKKRDVKGAVRKDSPPPKKLSRNVINRALDDENEFRARSLAAIRRAKQKEKQKIAENNDLKVIRDVIIPENISVQDLSARMAVRGADVIKALMKMGMMVTINQIIDADTAELICNEFGHNPKRVLEVDVLQELRDIQDDELSLFSRAPIVTIMGHVDHGKTSLLDALRETDVVAGEAGGITQHIGAYQVQLSNGKKITFIDTPGHAAFTEMRARGANVTDVVVLVVAADDSIKEQTVEAIHHAKAAKVPIVVAITKSDKPDANPAKVRTDLLQHSLVVEELGGEILAVDVSAKTKMNLDKLEESILLQAEILDLKANPGRAGYGVVVEAKMERGKGTVATLLVQNGHVNVGDIIVAGCQFGRIKALIDDHGRRIQRALPSMPVEVLGLNGVPVAGDELFVVESESQAREITSQKIAKERESKLAKSARSSIEQMMDKISVGEQNELAVVVKTDVHGSLEAIVNALSKLSTSEVSIRILHAGVGAINESDVTLAKASNAFVIGFNVRANPQARDMAKNEHIDIRYYSIIYDIIDEARSMMSGMLAPTLREKYIGTAEIREVFSVSKSGKIAGCYVSDGMVKRGSKVRLLRDSVVMHEGSLKTLKRFKDDVKEVKFSYECGMSFENYDDIKVGDVIECYEIEEVSREL